MVIRATLTAAERRSARMTLITAVEGRSEIPLIDALDALERAHGLEFGNLITPRMASAALRAIGFRRAGATGTGLFRSPLYREAA